jgi:Ca2+-binding RTX toxin-like protein
MFESLECRRLLTVTAVFENGIIKIQGDDLSNIISVARVNSTVPTNTGGNVVVSVVGSNTSTSTILLTVPYNQVLGIDARLGGGNDTFTSHTVDKPTTVYGDGGNDQITTGRGDDQLFGGDGNDRLTTLGGRNTLNGGLGNDYLIGGDGADDFIGGPGIDTVSYEGVVRPLRITLDNLPNDGGIGSTPSATEGDNVRFDIEVVIGGSGDDFISAGSNLVSASNAMTPVTLIGGPGSDTLIGRSGPLPGPTPANGPLEWRNAPTDGDLFGTRQEIPWVSLDGSSRESFTPYPTNTSPVTVNLRAFSNLFGGDGDDTLIGGNSNDLLDGGNGDDFLDGGRGDDYLFGGAGNDIMHGGDGNDFLNGGTGNDSMWGGNGNDRFFSRDGFADFLDGGDGFDTATADLDLDELINIEALNL